MPAPTVTRLGPAPTYPCPIPGIPRPRTDVSWTGGTGPFNVVYEWDTNPAFSSPIITVTNSGVTSPNSAYPTSDLGGVGVTWYARARVVDTFDAASTNSAAATLTFYAPIAQRRDLYLIGSAGVAFDPIDRPAGGWGAHGTPATDGYAIDFPRHLYLINNAGVGFDPKDKPNTGGPIGWGPAAGSTPADGFQINNRRDLYLLANAGVGFDPIDKPGAGWGPNGDTPGDGFAISFRRHLYLLAGDVNTATPVPHIWYVYPTFGRVGWEFRIIGFGFGDSEAAYAGTAALAGLNLGVVSWVLVAAVGTGMEINPAIDLANPVHQRIRVIVPFGAVSGTVVVTTNGP